MTDHTTINPGTILRMAGNIAAGIAPLFVRLEFAVMTDANKEYVVDLSTDLALRIAQKVAQKVQQHLQENV